MKKLVSILLIAIMLMSAKSVSVFAVALPEDGFYDRFVEEYGEPQFYHEEYYHYSSNDSTLIDWVLISAVTEIMVDPIENPEPFYYIIGDLVYSTIYYYEPFTTEYCVYDVLKDEFFGITEIDFDDYEGLREVFCTNNYGTLVGDVDTDGDVSIIDATEIQCIIAKLSELKNIYVADFNRDKELNILDATAIQLKLAKLDENGELVLYATDEFFSSFYAETMPIDATQVEFEPKLNYTEGYSNETCNVYSYYGYTLSIIKSKAQYNKMYNANSDEFTDEFFETHYLVAATTLGAFGQSELPISQLGIKDNTLYVIAEDIVMGGDTAISHYTSMVAVEKDMLKNVDSIVRVAPLNLYLE